jgi:aspartate racemase
VRTVYDLNITQPEQNSPHCILLSDPSIPDRTEAILAGSTEEILDRLCEALETLASMGAERIVIACVTIHHVLPCVPETLRRKVVSLIDLVIDEVLAVPRRYLLLTTTGTRAARIFEQHERWREIEGWIVHPSGEEQQALHEQLYLLKEGRELEPFPWLEDLASRHGAEGVIFGCTELHLLYRLLAQRLGKRLDPRVVDPLVIAARDLEKILKS